MSDPHPLTPAQWEALRAWPKEADYNRLPVAADPRPTYQEMVSLHQAYWRCINEGADEANVCAVPGKSNCRCWIKPSRNCRCPWLLPVARVARLSPQDPWKAAILIDDDSEPGGIRALKRWSFIPQWPRQNQQEPMSYIHDPFKRLPGMSWLGDGGPDIRQGGTHYVERHHTVRVKDVVNVVHDGVEIREHGQPVEQAPRRSWLDALFGPSQQSLPAPQSVERGALIPVEHKAAAVDVRDTFRRQLADKTRR